MKVTHLAWMAVAAMLLLAPMAMAAGHGGKGGAKGAVLAGQIKTLDLDNHKIIVAVKGKDKGAAEDKTVLVNDSTKVLIEKAAPGGDEKGRAKPEEGKLTDLKQDQKVLVRYTEEAGTLTATEIMVPAAHRGDKGGGHKGAPK
jgi:hypothetical protein